MLVKLIGRNLKLYFRNKLAVIFSLFAVIISIALYALFLANIQIDTVNQQTNNMLSHNDLSYLINSWILAGLLSITTVTSTLGAFGTMVNDRERKILMDFKSSPLSIMMYPVANVIAAFVVGVSISVLSMVMYGGYIYLQTGYYFKLEVIVLCLGVIILSTLMNAALMGFLVSFLSANSAFSSVSITIGSIIGFVNGVYVPLGSLPTVIQEVLNLLPFGHIASLFRRILLTDAIDICFKGAPQEVVDAYTAEFGVHLFLKGDIISVSNSLLFILGVCIVSLLLFFWNYNRKQEEF